MTEWLSALEWGDVPTWLSSLGGIGALIAATIAARASLAVLKIETRRDNDADEREQRAQADLVAAWIANDDPRFWATWKVVVVNQSNVPIYDVAVVVTSAMLPDGENKLDLYEPLIPPGQMDLSIRQLIRRVIENHGSEPNLDDDTIFTTESGMRLMHRVQIKFRDAAEVTWARSNFGTLTRVPDDPSDFRGDDLI